MNLLAMLLAVLTFPASSGAGPNGYDWMLGTWSCKNAAPTTIGGPAAQTFVAERANGGGLFMRISGTGLEHAGYANYDPKAGVWFLQMSYPSGNYYRESTGQTGAKTTWTGPYTTAATGKTMQVRDTIEILSATQYHQTGQYQSGGVWHTGFSGICTKT